MNDNRCSPTGKRASSGNKDGATATDPGVGQVGLVLRVTEGDRKNLWSLIQTLRPKPPPTT